MFYLTAAGVGHIRICDADVISPDNLNRQILYRDEWIGMEKAPVAAEVLGRLNPDIEITPLTDRIEPDSVGELVGDSGLILDCLDNFETRYVLNEYAVANGIPMIFAGVSGLEGMFSFIKTPETPCLRCIFPAAPKSSGVFPIAGPIAGMIGVMEALEALKYLTGVGNPVMGELVIFDGAAGEWSRATVTPRSDCPVCGPLRG